MRFTIGSHSIESRMTRDAVLHLLAAEAFLRRAALVDGPFALEGSLVLRQYLPDPDARIASDMDWIGTGPLDEAMLGDWMAQVTGIDCDDGIQFLRTDDRCRDMADYAMVNVFPTMNRVNTELPVRVGDEKLTLRTEVTFEVPLALPPVPLVYRSLTGDSFDLPATCALELQLAWKLHQSMRWPHFEDLVDILWLLRARRVDAEQVAEVLRNRCIGKWVPLADFAWLLHGTLTQHSEYSKIPLQKQYAAWRAKQAGAVFPQPESLPVSGKELLTQLSAALRESGFRPFPESDG